MGIEVSGVCTLIPTDITCASNGRRCDVVLASNRIRSRRRSLWCGNAWHALWAISLPFMSAGAEPGQSGFDQVAFDRYMEGHLRNTGIPGVSVAITNKSSITLVKGYGQDGSGAPMTAHTPMFIGSLSKSVTAVAVMQLVERGRLELDRQVHEYLPEFHLADARYLRITVRQLLNQSSGMADRTYFEWSRPGPTSLREAVQNMRPTVLVADPGTEFNYHNPNFEVAARLVEVVSGRSFSSYLSEQIFKPLGMNDSFVVDRLDQVGNPVPRGHVFLFGRPVPVSQPAFFLSGAGGVVSSAADMAQWLLFHENGGVSGNGTRLLSEAGMELVHRASAPDGRYGFGWVDETTQQSSRMYHAGWTPTFTAFQNLSRDGSHSFAILSNGGRTFIRGSGASYVQFGVQAVEAGESPQSYGESTRDLDVMFSATALLLLAVALRAVSRARVWAEAAARRPRWNTIARLAPWGIGLVLIIAIPKIGGDALGHGEVPWSAMMETSMWVWFFYVSPLGVLLCATVALGCAAVLCARSMALHRRDHV